MHTQHAQGASPHDHHAHGGAPMSPSRLTTAATLHCLTGCAIGEWGGCCASR